MLICLAITGHWIDNNWKLHEALMEFKYVEGHHYVEILSEKVHDVLKDYNICQKLFCIIGDSVSNNGTMYEEIERLLGEEGISWSAEKNHIHCMNHVINLAVQDFLKSIKAIKMNADSSGYMEEDLEFDGHGPMLKGFALALYKIRTITKVIYQTITILVLSSVVLSSEYQLMFRKLPQVCFTLNISINVVNSQSSQPLK